MSDAAAPWDRVKPVLHAALGHAPEDRARFLRETCGDDHALRHEVESLLLAHGEAGDFAEQPAIEAFVSSPPSSVSRDAPGGGILQPGSRLGPYEVGERIGRGGMGEVYRARDTRLGRSVAIKVLPPHVAADAELRRRFEREARTLAALSHPHICAVFDVGHQEPSTGSGPAVDYLVMEYLDGETLAARLTRGPLPLDEALHHATHIAEALEAAHANGIIHRDLKPGNIMLAEGGTKVLDFGLAKMLEGDAPNPDLTQATLMPSATGEGWLVGTPAYMSPEQARGKPVDRRSDVWAFGCVLFEMLTGKRTFGAAGAADTIAAVVREEPDWRALPANTPAAIRRLLRRALAKDPRNRLADASTARLEIAEAATEGQPPLVHAPTGAKGALRRASIGWVVAAAFAVALGVALALPYLRAPADRPEMRVDIATPGTSDPLSFAISPDGRRIVFVASADGEPARLWLRPLDASIAQPLAGTDGARHPFWSPDGRSVAFFAANQLKRLDLDSGALQTIAGPTRGDGGGSWGSGGVILFAPGANDHLLRVAASGGPTSPASEMELPRQNAHVAPHFLPDGRQFLFWAVGTAEAQGTYLGALDSLKTRKLVDADSSPAFLAPDWLLTRRQGALIARKFDPTTGTMVGESITVASAVTGFSVAANGTVAYRAASNRRQLVWFDRAGRALGTFGDADDVGTPALSPDGSRVAVNRAQQGNADLWILDGGRTTRFTFDPAVDRFAVWSPDGRQISFDSNRKTGVRDLYVKSSTDASSETLLLASPQNKASNSWSADGRLLFYSLIDPKTQGDLWVLPLLGERTPYPFLDTPADERSGMISPNGRWVAYSSNESGRHEIYVRPFPARGGQWQASSAGGVQPRWRPDGRELYYVSPADRRLMAVSITEYRSTLERGTPTPLFQTSIVGGGNLVESRQQYDVSRDGRFLINTMMDDASSPITLLLNWNPSNHDGILRLLK